MRRIVMSSTSYPRRPLAALLMATVLAASIVMAVVVLASPAWAATLTVNSTADTTDPDGCTTAPGGCTLREAISAANTSSGVADTINFDLGSAATITLTSAQLPDITDEAGLTIDGGSADVTISGGNQHRVFNVRGSASTRLTLNNLTVADGRIGPGAGIQIYDGTLTVSNSTISGNSSGCDAGGILNWAGTVTLSNSTVAGNSAECAGGGISSYFGTLTVSNSTISGNSAPFDGGGIYQVGGTLTVNNSTISGNSANGVADLFPSGGGIYNEGGTATVRNSTLSGNSATLVGGGIFNSSDAANNGGTLTVSNSTLSGNSNNGGFGGGGIHNEDGTATLKNTIVAKSPSASGVNCAGTITNGGYNLDSATSCGFPTQNSSKDPLLGPLADNGGPTKTHALLEGSPAIDKGNSFGATTDQRGLPRPSNFVGIINAGDGSDIGAFELQAPPTPPKVTSTVPGNGGEGGPAVNVRATFSEDMLVSSITGQTFKLFKKGTTTKIAATVSYNADIDMAKLDPTNNLRKGATYKALVTTEAKDVAGNRLDQDSSTTGLQQKVWYFTVED